MISDGQVKLATGLPCTGERFLPENVGVIALEHLHRYLLARELAKDRQVLDIASGEGYGSAMLAEVATGVVGVDISAEAVRHARVRYGRANLEFREGRADAIPLPNGSVDLVVSFETIEHHDRHEEMMAEIRRVLRPDGVLIVSSPDKREYSDIPRFANPFHVKELYREEFERLLAASFENVAIYGQRVCYGSAIAPDSGEGLFSTYAKEGPGYSRVDGVRRPVYFVALASNRELPLLGGSLFEVPGDASGSAAQLSVDSHARDVELGRLKEAVGERDRRIAGLRQAVAERDRQLRQLRHATAG
jgi:SAM-dependent methyltransferase